MMEIQEIAEKAAEMLRSDDKLAGATVLVEEKGDLASDLAIKTGKRRLAIVVGWNGFKSDATSSKTIVGKGKIAVSVYEMPILNRKSPGAITILQAAREVAYRLNLEPAFDGCSPLVFQEITPVMQLSGGESAIVATDVVFEAEAVL